MKSLFQYQHYKILLIFLLGNSSLSAQEMQVWEISILDQNQQVQATASMQCLAGGACDASSWTLLTTANFGCEYNLDFSVQFSGDLVRLLLFQETLDTNCANMRLLVGTGSGTADAPYPRANNASGEVTLGFEGGGMNSTGTARWEAKRL
ncbi:MAG: hypothetical protein COA71_08030 [SAR86 cluster bacterium]|uniref:CUB domain-containing protein n=1 Tax=SAR86 cluster bacterium TaxID=2030880 RepID=A0A2A5CCC7_9GAMM|nr:hypothetical protein [Gammaproteobacteria bacterium AH-315-E17]PCJ41497.1 MAG: hypothetical protein COA71_08030 [SAR86 cluster bacterium]